MKIFVLRDVWVSGNPKEDFNMWIEHEAFAVSAWHEQQHVSLGPVSKCVDIILIKHYLKLILVLWGFGWLVLFAMFLQS